MTKDYKKALDLYNDGFLDKSIKYCNEIIAKDLKNSSVLNLKGLMLYLKGDLNEATNTWKINYNYNKDQVSKAYLKDTKADKEKIKLYREAQQYLKELKIKEAINLLEECKESDFNAIAVNNALAVCYYRKGEFDIAKAYIIKSISIDKKNSETISIMKKIDEVNGTKSNNKYIGILLVAIIAISTVTVAVVKNKNHTTNEENQITEKDDTIEAKQEEVQEEIKKEPEAEESNEEEIILSQEEIENKYIDASTYFEEEMYEEALVELETAYKTKTESHLKDDIAFLLASTYEKLNKNKEAIDTFEEYISLDEEGNYIEEAYYKLALLNKESNLSKAKEYAEKIANDYTESIYNNDNIKAIISS